MWLFKLGLIIALACIAVVAVMYATQTQMLFPTRLATASGFEKSSKSGDWRRRLFVIRSSGETMSETGVQKPYSPDIGRS